MENSRRGNSRNLRTDSYNSTNDSANKKLLIVSDKTALVPAYIAAGGQRAGFAFIDFFTAQIRNRNTRAAYAVAVRAFFDWCGTKHLTLTTLQTHHVAAYIEWLARRYEAPTVKQHCVFRSKVITDSGRS